MLTEFHIGVDDTDSKLGGCTTYTATLIFQELLEKGFTPSDFPWLIRLNPNVPWKTRGNGALSIHLHCEESRLREAEQLAIEIVGETSDPSVPQSDPVVVFVEGRPPTELEIFSQKALHDIISLREARCLLRKINGHAHIFKGCRGLIGALAAIGSNLSWDHTFEIIAYRCKSNWGTPRQVDLDSVRSMNSKYKGKTFNNIDDETGRILICPHGPDPVLFGIRGETPTNLLEASKEILTHEPIERLMIFRSNQGTDAHLTCKRTIESLKTFQSTVLIGEVLEKPKVIPGGHVIFSLGDGTARIDCAAYKPSASLKNTAQALLPGDLVRALGGVRRGPERRLTLNLEKLEMLQIVKGTTKENPACTACRSRCESLGRGQGFRCRKCRLRFPSGSKVSLPYERNLDRSVYMPPPRSHRHLTRPASRSPKGRTSETHFGIREELEEQMKELDSGWWRRLANLNCQ